MNAILSKQKQTFSFNAPTLLTKPAGWKFLGNGGKPFTTVVAYEDSLGRSNADRLYSRLLEEFHDDFDFDSRWWSFEQLSQPCTAENAASVTRKADLIIISTASEDLPGHAKLWIEACLARKGAQDMAMVALIGAANPQKGSPTAAHAYLERVAQEAGLSYFSGLFELCELMSACTIEALQIRADAVTPLLEEILRSQPSPHWGINE